MEKYVQNGLAVILKTEDTSMKKLTNFVKRLWKDESAQGATEYILLLVVIVGLVLMFGPKIKGIVSGKVDELSGMIQSVKQ
jgi:Flp pilus assembly pilin Flp